VVGLQDGHCLDFPPTVYLPTTPSMGVGVRSLYDIWGSTSVSQPPPRLGIGTNLLVINSSLYISSPKDYFFWA